jgi:hypothetical protein
MKGGRAERAEVPGYDSPGAHRGRRKWRRRLKRRDVVSSGEERREQGWSGIGLGGERLSAIACGQLPVWVESGSAPSTSAERDHEDRCYNVVDIPVDITY